MTVLRLVDKNNAQSSVVDLLEMALREAKEGKLIAVTLSGVNSDGDLVWDTAINGKWAQCVAAVTSLTYDVLLKAKDE